MQERPGRAEAAQGNASRDGGERQRAVAGKRKREREGSARRVTRARGREAAVRREVKRGRERDGDEGVRRVTRRRADWRPQGEAG